MSDSNRYRLPTTVKPSRYVLVLEPDLEAATFSGAASIDLRIDRPVDQVVLNAVDLQFQQCWIEREMGRIDLEPDFDEQTERCTLDPGGTLEAGDWVLHISFTGVLNDKLRGFYLSTFKDDGGTEHRIATTQMEAPHARRAFPCWDEPDFKAVFEITLVVPEHLAAFSNGAEFASTPAPGSRKAVHFAPTMKMSTYLVAFIVGPLQVSEPVDAAGTPLRVAYPPSRERLTSFALESGAFAVKYFNDYYGIRYPAGKLDLIAVPDFAFGAMENLGCITFRETALLIDPARATQPELQRVADVIHHEIAHMWFGDLVTMKWWNGIWLNEAFATFMEMKCTDAFRPEWMRWVDFGLSRSTAFDVDSLASTRPVEYEVVSPEDAEGMFDVLTYEKGAAVLLMLEQYLGEEAFMDGVRQYLRHHSFGNTETTDLWDCIEEASGQPVRRIMDTWIFQGGYPILSASLAGQVLTLSQRRFMYNGKSDQLWVVPVIVRYGAGDRVQTSKLLLEDGKSSFNLDFEPEWLVVNSQAAGFYRVHYETHLLEGILRYDLNPVERYQLVDDLWAAVLAGLAPASDFVDMARSFIQESDLSVWTRIVGGLGSLGRIVPEQGQRAFQAAVRSILRPALDRLGLAPVNGESERDTQLRGTLFEAMGSLGKDRTTKMVARELHTSFLTNPQGMDPALVAAATSIVAEQGTAEDFEIFWRRHKEAESPQLAIRYLHALARFEDPSLFQRMLELSTAEVRSQDAPLLLQAALSSRTCGPQAWHFVTENWETMVRRFPENLLVRVAGGIRTFTDPALASAAEEFFAEHPIKQSEKTLAQHLEKMRVNVELKRREATRFFGAERPS
ncbi:MAG: M1 family metallopeptidase [Actinomycetota bacterium]